MTALISYYDNHWSANFQKKICYYLELGMTQPMWNFHLFKKIISNLDSNPRHYVGRRHLFIVDPVITTVRWGKQTQHSLRQKSADKATYYSYLDSAWRTNREQHRRMGPDLIFVNSSGTVARSSHYNRNWNRARFPVPERMRFHA